MPTGGIILKMANAHVMNTGSKRWKMWIIPERDFIFVRGFPSVESKGYWKCKVEINFLE
jgi:hypothetical protein